MMAELLFSFILPIFVGVGILYVLFIKITDFCIWREERKKEHYFQKNEEVILKNLKHDPTPLELCSRSLGDSIKAIIILQEEARSALSCVVELEKESYLIAHQLRENQIDARRFLQKVTWGKLERQYGHVFDTLTDAQESLVDYPPLCPECVFFTTGGKAYHSVSYCYTLDQSHDILHSSLTAALDMRLHPCSKCVSPKSRFYPSRQG